MSRIPEWHIITCEYPPKIGGVSDHTWLVARGLAREGDRVQVWCPSGENAERSIPGVSVDPVLGSVDIRGLRCLGRRLDQFKGPRRLLVQWVPHGYGYRSMNLAFCLWLWSRAKRSHDEVDIVVHEPFLPFRGGSWKQYVAAGVHRLMATIILHAASRIWITIPVWEQRLRPYMLRRRVPVQWLPIPSNVECSELRAETSTNDAELNAKPQVLGHFGGLNSSVSEMVEPLISPLLRGHSNRSLILIGRDSLKFRTRIVDQNPGLSHQIHATGELTSGELSSWIETCSIMIQPYPDGVSSRRGTAIAGLCHGVPVVTTKGTLTEELWEQSGAVGLAPAGDVIQLLNMTNDLLANAQKRTEMSIRARQFYAERFDVRHTIRALRSTYE